jgi:hypothetical protein
MEEKMRMNAVAIQVTLLFHHIIFEGGRWYFNHPSAWLEARHPPIKHNNYTKNIGYMTTIL